MGGIKRQALLREERHQRPATLADLLAQGVDVFCWCNRCSHNAVLPLQSLLPVLGPQCPVPEVGARLVCTSCGCKDIATRPAWKGLGQVTSHEPPAPAPTPADSAPVDPAPVETSEQEPDPG